MTDYRPHLLTLAALCVWLPPAAAQPDKPTGGNAVATALAFTHLYGSPDALTPAKDRAVKTKLIVALGKSPELTWEEAGDFFDKTTFRALAGGKDSIPVAAMERAVQDATPRSRSDMYAKTRLHADLLSTQFDLIEDGHRKAGGELAEWVVKNYKPGKPLGVVIMCTGNTRRSVMGAAMGNVAAAYHGLPDLKFYSGGTDPDAVNPRSVAALKDVGIEIEDTGNEAPQGKKGVKNPIYRMKWGKGLETTEFSKKYTDPANPQENFAAVLVCSEADSACPMVAGAGVRVLVPYLDPKAFDGAAFEAAKYAERRDDQGRFMLSVLLQARRRLDLDGKLK